MTARGRFITIEGVEGVGKSTNLRFIETWLSERGIPYLTTREPGGTALGESVRELLLARSESPMDAMTELLLMFAARAEHVVQVIRPALAAGSWVISDRFTDSSYAYQGGGRGIPASTIAAIEQAALGDFKPDATLLLDLPVASGLDRAAQTGAKDRFELESMAFFDRVRAVFLSRAAEDARFEVVDASRGIDAVQSDIADWLTRESAR